MHSELQNALTGLALYYYTTSDSYFTVYIEHLMSKNDIVWGETVHPHKPGSQHMVAETLACEDDIVKPSLQAGSVGKGPH